MKHSLAHFARIEFAPPDYLALPTAGMDISASGIKTVMLKERLHGLEVSAISEERLPAGVIQNGEIADHVTLTKALAVVAARHGIRRANITLPEARGYLFEADATGKSRKFWRTSVEQHLDEYVPLPPAEVAFDVAPLTVKGDEVHVVGIGYARRVADAAVQVFEDAGIEVRALESETFALPRAILPHGDTETVMVIDIGKTTTKLLVVSHRLPRFATTLDVGGHALTLAVQKHFGVTEEEAKRVKAEQGLVAGAENAEYQAAMLSTVSVIREEIVRRLDYWQSRAGQIPAHEPVTRAILVGGNATVRGLPEYLGASLKIPVELGDIFKNLASRDEWLPPIDYMESLAYGTAVGLALREHVD
ncbi:MAG: type IV pilus assembly protein PilM [Parcubacteria bacterium C7867-008]|nr:MAG: type IV pilus assembly protein PilM [Parcubacteria bacterium C7867-008]